MHLGLGMAPEAQVRVRKQEWFPMVLSKNANESKMLEITGKRTLEEMGKILGVSKRATRTVALRLIARGLMTRERVPSKVVGVYEHTYWVK